MTEIHINQATLDALTNLSCKIEILRNNIELLHSLIWGGILEGDAKAVDRAAALVEMILETAYQRDEEFSEIVHNLEGAKLPEME